MATVASIMTGITPDPTYEGPTTADDMVFAVDFNGTNVVGTYLVADDGVTAATGSLEAQTQESTYLRRGQVTTKTGTNRSFNVTGERIVGDDFQDAVLAHAIKFGKGADVIFSYVYFNALTGKGEQGKVSVQVSDDFSGDASNMAGFTVDFNSTEAPTEYTYVVTP